MGDVDPSSVQFAFLDTSQQAIHGKLSFDETEIYVSIVYGSCDYRERRDLWGSLIYHSAKFSGSPWVIMGDFNVSRYPSKHIGERPLLSSHMIEFERCIEKCEIEDLRQTGHFFSLSNKRARGESVGKKIDRAMGNWCWFNEFSDLQAHFPPPGISDHSPCIMPFQRSIFSGARPFKYLNAWASHPSFLGLVKEVWSRRVEGSMLEVVGKKLRMLKPILKELHRNFFKDPVSECGKLKYDLIVQQAILDGDPTNEDARSTEKQLLEKYYKASRVEESFLKQKARVQ
ncbi:Exo_endo_phos domain-containing protein [Cephalotus follicularis]|uniref:Exo_endo_phos domain-containing protein n=1 Tax=Cephalotus follicularis TaxID=3775 RepID=A0A1Q3BM33_CEPFO|nr:Exo_endo_phos domain-containing protein [Cephalotus follicularis]